jgi:DNA-directed RNA polymerase subunit H (RpoH/RPB5)
MHVLQPNYAKMSSKEVEKLLNDLNISLIQLPKIKLNDPSLPKGCEISDIIKIERVSGGKKTTYYRVVSV